ncbi:sulfite exporter TauE/SafE family protein [Williamsoniiplasma lucivorax]|uniref:Probable membrane transporter protein n=1 Tax=Williamsoniiplasma lucivorax TaxID=209274 RepID=A0A2S5RF27_9MOLU|nr:sulfite exporter TauE/SafE family protein [Williamsoniiplasma lucivorax]PPE05897.1 hypothetical protein ELUCI_v1c01870 [Williamsoniiplasma lucivorax]
MKSLNFLKKMKNKATPNNNLTIQNDYRKRLFKWLMFLISALVATSLALIINYFVLKTSDERVNIFTKKESIFAFVIMIVLLVLAISFSVVYFISSSKIKYNDEDVNKRNVLITGFTAGFTDTISVGSFGIATAILKGTKTIKDDSKLPGTLNVGFALSGTLEAALFVSAIEVDVATLVILLMAILVGTFIGSALVARIKDPKVVKVFMGVILFVVAIMMILSHPQIGVIGDKTAGTNTLMESTWRIIVGTIIFFFLGMVQSFGIGLFAPALASLSFLGLKMEAIFPIMSCGSALSMMPAAFNFVRKKQYMQLTASIIQITSVFGLIVAFLIVFVGIKQALGEHGDFLFNAILKWLGIAVIFYVSITMLVEYYKIIKQEKLEKRC